MISHLFIDHAFPPTRGVRIARGVVAFVLGFIWVVIAGFESHRAWREGNWAQSTCTIVRSDVVPAVGLHDKHDSYVLHTRFRFAAGPREMAASQEDRFEDVSEADALAESRSTGTVLPCWVNGGLARLEAQRPWAMHVFLAITIVANLALLYFYVIPQFRAPRSRSHLQSMERKAKFERIGAWILGIGAIAWLTFGFGVPLIESARAASWPAVPCTIEANSLAKDEVHGEVHLTLYRPDVLFRYDVGGRAYRSNCFSFSDYASPWFAGKRRDADQFPAGAQATCRVDPNNPRRAVLTLRPGPTQLIALFPLTLLALAVATAHQHIKRPVTRPSAKPKQRARVNLPAPFQKRSPKPKAFYVMIVLALVMCIVTASFVADLFALGYANVPGDQWIYAALLVILCISLIEGARRQRQQ